MTDVRDPAEQTALLVIVTFNSYDHLPDIAESVRQFVDARPGNYVAIIENSGDGRIPDHLNTACPGSRVLAEVAPSNEGFSHGVNLGISLARQKWGHFDVVALMNPDVLAGGSVVAELVDRAPIELAANVGIWGPVLRDEAGAIDRGCARRAWNYRRLFSHILGHPNLAKVLGTPQQNLTMHEIRSDQSDLAMAGGALMCIRSEVIDDGLDTRLPMYLEDQEICMRAGKKGYSVHVHPDLMAVHIGGVSRKSVTKHERALRIMELVESPVQCMHRLQNYDLLRLRLIVLIAGITRLLAVAPTAAGKVARGNVPLGDAPAWTVGQFRLAWWYVLWAVSGRFHETEISLHDYINSFADKSGSRLDEPLVA